jgi:signal transduction histidine kinase
MPMSKSDWELDPLVRNAHNDLGRVWIRLIIAAVVSSFLFEFLNAAVGATWLAMVVAVEGAGAMIRHKLRSGDLRWCSAFIWCHFVNALVWVTLGAMLWSSGADLARYAALISLFSVSLYAANGGGTDRRLMFVFLTPPVAVLLAIVLSYVWPNFPVHVALFASLSTLGSCAVIVLNAHVMVRNNERLVESARELSAAARAKDSFLADVSHEIRTPLNGVLALAGALERTPLDAKQREMVALISGSGETMRRLVTGMLDLAKIESGHLGLNATEFDLAAEIEAADAQPVGAELLHELAHAKEGRLHGR